MARKIWIYNPKSDCAIETEAIGLLPVGWEPLTKRDQEINEEVRREKMRAEREMWLDLLG